MSPKQVIDFFGSQVATARALGIEQPSVSAWLKTGEVPMDRQYQIELATQGKLRADLPAMRVSQ